MATGPQVREARAFLKGNGYSVELIFEPSARAQWYRADGTPLPDLLPVAPYYMESFRKKGWTLQPPAKPTTAEPLGPAPAEAAVQPQATGKVGLTQEERTAKLRENLAKARAAKRAARAQVQEGTNV